MSVKREMPDNFPAYAHMCNADLLQMFSANYYQIVRWRSELGMDGAFFRHKRPVIQYKDGVEVARYDSVDEAARSVHGGVANIIGAMRGRLRTAYGYKWAYETRCVRDDF